ncbi:MAG: hypothetical protein FD130_2643, partial [Halothiobacillaceae bacterium]
STAAVLAGLPAAGDFASLESTGQDADLAGQVVS